MNTNSILYRPNEIRGTVEASTQTLAIPTIYTIGTRPATLQPFNIPNNSAFLIKLNVLAIQSGGSAGTIGTSVYFEASALIKNIAGTTTLINSNSTQVYGDAGGNTWTVSFSVDDNTDQLTVTVLGQANKNVCWSASIVYQILSY